ncbi:hypothetical protein [Vibrio spartinae]|uniref:Uncharacterized protein n=1 Tax=Vibrio spartinae TaxID=1918945 RepID=A0A1N6M708_9VIBR|nr:hypothetical protein [Vibrio spartinae]QMV14306.1 hypothetical protein Vspart_01560 [Vibrio spartinae]SIO95116.1 hypothetical protein VSP9026_02855 [Vibrio spartinae]
MKHSSSTYRLNMIKEVALKQHGQSNDPMANYIHHLLHEQPRHERKADSNRQFTGNHFDEQAGGWVNDRWHTNK